MNEPNNPIADLSTLVRKLRGPEGCPWDREQRLVDLRAYLLEEAHEVAAAIDSGDWDDLRAELGDLLFQVVFIADLAEEQSAFDLLEVSREIEAKMVARHPHVFGSERLSNAAEVHRAWERRKLASKATTASILDGLPDSLPSLLASYRMTQKVAGVGFDWPDAKAVFEKVEEELEELRQAIQDGSTQEARQEAISEEIGDLLFTAVHTRESGAPSGDRSRGGSGELQPQVSPPISRRGRGSRQQPFEPCRGHDRPDGGRLAAGQEPGEGRLTSRPRRIDSR
ncbi:MAG: nucleoside triphosphate pyrophosphohydrolase [Nitrospirae bacterium]|nr:nucleoside triphosphate pyrophosphohydrolase [Nitrospirota bacterium]